jgi:hypothetical protein
MKTKNLIKETIWLLKHGLLMKLVKESRWVLGPGLIAGIVGWLAGAPPLIVLLVALLAITAAGGAVNFVKEVKKAKYYFSLNPNTRDKYPPEEINPKAQWGQGLFHKSGEPKP